MRFLSRADLEQAIAMPAAIVAVRQAFQALSANQAEVPMRSAIEIPSQAGVTLFMPAFVPSPGALGCKVVSVHPRNRESGLPVIQAIVLLIDESTGTALAAMDGTFLTSLRTGAASGVATQALSRPDSRVLTCFGAGPQAETQIEAVCQVREIERVWILSRSGTSAIELARKIAGRGRIPADVRGTDDPNAAVAQADIICTATPSQTPLFDGANLRPGSHINAVGSFTPEMKEVDIETLRRSLIFVDSRGPCLAEAGELIAALGQKAIASADSWTEIGAVLQGMHPGRTSDKEITYFKSVGNAAQDVATARVALDNAQLLGLGVEVAF